MGHRASFVIRKHGQDSYFVDRGATLCIILSVILGLDSTIDLILLMSQKDALNDVIEIYTECKIRNNQYLKEQNNIEYILEEKQDLERLE